MYGRKQLFWMGEEAIRYARSYALDAERRLGGLLLQTERAKGAAGVDPITVTYSDHNAPTLADLGLAKRDEGKAVRPTPLPSCLFHHLMPRGKRLRI